MSTLSVFARTSGLSRFGWTLGVLLLCAAASACAVEEEPVQGTAEQAIEAECSLEQWIACDGACIQQYGVGVDKAENRGTYCLCTCI